MQEKVILSCLYACIIDSYMAGGTQKIKTTHRGFFIDMVIHCFKDIHSLFYFYLFLVLLGIAFFAASLFINNFTTPFTGDYILQQYAFYTNGYDDWWHFIKTGEFILYDTNTFLGVNNIGSNSFYYLFDPFFLPILLFPRQIIPQGMAITTIFKIALSGLSFYAYMRVLGASKRASKITGIAYAFSGWITWYLWFNHFTGMAITFPLILLGIEKLLKNKNPLILIGSICLLGFVNFFFMFTFVLCGFFYFVFRYFQEFNKRLMKDNLIIILLSLLSFAIGIAMPMMIVLPSLSYVLSSPRASSNGILSYLREALKSGNLKKVFDLLFNWTSLSNNEQNKARFLFPFIEFIFPVTTCRGTSLTIYAGDTYDNVSGSFYCFIPMLLLLFPAFKTSLKNRHYSVLIPLVFFIFALFTPIFYYLFHGFTQAYSRWTLFVVTSIMAYSGLYLDEIKKEDNYVVLIQSTAILIIMVLIGGFVGQTIISQYKTYFSERLPIWLVTSLEILYIFLLAIALIVVKNVKKHGFYWVFTGFLSLEVIIMGALVINGHGVEKYAFVNKGISKNNELYSLVSKTSKNDKSFYRSYSSLGSEVAYNDGMRNGYNGINMFHSAYNYNTADFCNWSSITNGRSPSSWYGTYVQKRINVDTLLGVKYYYIENDYFAKQNRSEATSDSFTYNIPFNYLDISSEYSSNVFKIYKNCDYLDFALTFDSYYVVDGNPTKSSMYSGLNNGFRNTLVNEELYLRACLVNNYRESGVIKDLENNHQDINLYSEANRTLNDYFTNLKIGKFDNLKSTDDAVLTYYDFGGSSEKALDVDANVYLTLGMSESKYPKVSNLLNSDSYQRYVTVIESKDSYFPNYDAKGNIYYVTSTYERGFENDIYFVDTDDKIVAFDDHNDGFCNNYRDGKEERGFYIKPTYSLNTDGSISIVKDAPKIKKIIFVSRGDKVDLNRSISIDTYTNYMVKISSLKENQLNDIKTTNNKYTFSTNFDKERIVVTRLAYEEGFKLFMKDDHGIKKDINVFNAQGGFVSFISGTGKCTYTLSYYTPNLKNGSLISSISILVYLSMVVSYVYLDLRKKEHLILQSI